MCASAQAYLLGGAQLSGSFVDLYQLKGNIDQAYAFPAFHFDLHLCRANLPPHTAVRGPGEIQVCDLHSLSSTVGACLTLDLPLISSTVGVFTS